MRFCSYDERRHAPRAAGVNATGVGTYPPDTLNRAMLDRDQAVPKVFILARMQVFSGLPSAPSAISCRRPSILNPRAEASDPR